MMRFDFSLVNPEVPIKTQASVFLFASDFWVTLTKRKLRTLTESNSPLASFSH